ncbi:hypothetical protein Zmor_003986 [Zophobas morio]|uniref:Ras-GEF domain-containing protein n=1 Tax=Zophobas morio TaxID=2755281 RepID=A0AA38HN67_9CUCU|nr:hypothetical protein Zmor_003986 [Zophobas morio]
MTETLEGKTPEKRAKIVTYFIGLAQTLKLLNNFHSLKAILAGLQGNPIFRLKKTWKGYLTLKKKELFLLTEAAEVSRKLISMNLPAVCVLLQLEGACIYKTQFDSGDA